MIEVSAYVLNIENCDHSIIEDNQSLLPASSIKRLSDFTNSKVKIQSFVGEILARYAISEHFDVPYILSDFSFAARGKPFLSDYEGYNFNISHSKNWLACAVSDVNVGVDVEGIRKINSKVADRFFTEREVRYLNTLNGDERNEMFIRFWTIKESYLKAIGKGLALELNSFNIEPKGDDDFVLDNNKDAEKYSVFSYKIKDAYVAVCAEKPAQKPRLICTDIDKVLKNVQSNL
ncbi:MAG: 4'-phosphopantetheinyl transferase family protein [Bacteroidales bacterium]|jgi:4'-phosphopantetheinyl transferase